MKTGDKLWYFDGSRCPQKVRFNKYLNKTVKVLFPNGNRAVMECYLFEDFEELIIAVEGHAWVLGKWARENKL